LIRSYDHQKCPSGRTKKKELTKEEQATARAILKACQKREKRKKEGEGSHLGRETKERGQFVLRQPEGEGLQG